MSIERKPDGTEQHVVSPSDLVGFLACPYYTSLSLEVARQQRPKPVSERPDVDVITRRGREHERLYKEALIRAKHEVVEIERPEGHGLDAIRHGEELTRQAIEAGTDVVFQATFVDDSGDAAWIGYADFLRRISPAGEDPPRYEAQDTKLARQVKPGAVLQLCNYSDHLARVQGAQPESVQVVLGGQRIESLRVDDFAAYYRAMRAHFEGALTEHDGTYPIPCSHCSVCRFQEVCEARWTGDDHLSLVAGITREQVRHLEAAGITTVTALAQTTSTGVKNIGTETFDRIRRQADLQVKSKGKTVPEVELIANDDPTRGLGGLPAPSAGDLYWLMVKMSHDDPRVAEIFEALTTWVSVRDIRIWLQVRDETEAGNPSPAKTAAALFGLRPAAVRKVCQRVREKVPGLAGAGVPAQADALPCMAKCA